MAELVLQLPRNPRPFPLANGFQVACQVSQLARLFWGLGKVPSLDDRASDSINANGLHSEIYHSPDGNALDASALLPAGKIASLLNVRDACVQDSIDICDVFAQILVTTFNAQHALGFDLNGNAAAVLFAPIAVATGAAAAVTLDPTLAGDPRSIAAAQSASTF